MPRTTLPPLSEIKAKLTRDEQSVLDTMIRFGHDPEWVEKYWLLGLMQAHSVEGIGEPSQVFLDEVETRKK